MSTSSPSHQYKSGTREFTSALLSVDPTELHLNEVSIEKVVWTEVLVVLDHVILDPVRREMIGR